jgi:hypothetical protein
MTAVRAAERARVPDAQVLATLRGCQDVIERLEQGAQEVGTTQIDMALTVMTHALVEFGRQESPQPVVLGAVRNAVDRLKRLRGEFSA